MKTKLFLMSATLLAALSLTGVASADTTRDQIEAEGNQQIQAYWNEYQQALQEREDAWEQGQGNRYSEAYMTADAKAGATYQEWLQAQTRLGDDLHNYDVTQWQREQDPQQADQPSQQSQQTKQATATQASQTSSEQPQTEATKADQPQTKTSTVQPSQQASVEAKSATHGPQQATTSQVSDKTANLPVQSKKPLQSSTEQSSVATLPQTGNQAGLGAISIGIASALAMFGLAGVKRD